MVARRLEATAPANESPALAALFFLHLFGSSRSINVGASISCSWQLALAKSFLSCMKLGLRYAQESENKQASLPMNNDEKSVEFKTGVQSSMCARIDLEVSWFDDCSRLVIFQV